MNPADLFQLPAGTGYIPWSEMEEVYIDFAAAMKKYGPSHYYDYNPVTGQWMLKESKQMRALALMKMDLSTVTAGDDPEETAAVAAPPVPKTKIRVYFTNTLRMLPTAILKDIPEKGESITVAEFISTYPALAATFDGKDLDSRMDYFFTRHTKRTDDGNAIYVPIKENAQLFRDMLEEEAEEAYG